MIEAQTKERPRILQTGDAAMRVELLAALESANWNMTVAARECGLAGPSSVLRMIPRLGLSAEYDTAKRDGRVSPGSRASSLRR